MAQETVKVPYSKLIDLQTLIDILKCGFSQRGSTRVKGNKSHKKYETMTPQTGNLEFEVIEGGAGDDIEVIVSGDNQNDVDYLSSIFENICI